MIYNIDDRFEVRPYGNGLCWEIFEYRKVKARDGHDYMDWVSTGKYPSTLGHALRIILDDLLKDGDSPIRGLKATSKKVEEIYKRIEKVVEDAVSG